MKKVVYHQYGDENVLEVVQADLPVIYKADQILVNVVYSSLNAIDWKNRKGLFKIFTGFFKPRTQQGFDFLGVITDKAKEVSDYHLGDYVVGQLGNFTGGALSEYIVVSTSQVIVVPNSIDKKQMGCMPMAAVTAWQALFENADLKQGQSVLINGGSSGVGHFAIQIAKAYGAQVTSVSSGKNVAFCKRLGADFALDYEKEHFTQLNKKFDIIFDVVFTTSYSQVKHILSPKGKYIGTTPSLKLIKDIVLGKRARFVAVRPNRKALADIVRLMEEGKVVTHIDKEFNLEQIVEAHTYIQRSKTVGKIMINVSQG